MSAYASCHNFIKASMEASNKGVQHILTIKKSGGTIFGSDNRMYAIINNP